MSEPLVSFCVPTYNRSRYLDSLLGSLQDQLAGFPYAYEIVIADNASPDATANVVESFQGRLPIRYFRHAENIGGFPNWQFVMAQAQGRYAVYVADDDSIMGEQVAQTIAKMEADPEIVVVYAPWLLYDLVGQREQGQFYKIPRDLRVERGRHAELLQHVLAHQIFPEVQIVRRDALSRAKPRINPHAFFAFVHAADYLNQGAVLIQATPFYVAITRYFADETRDQLGNEEVESAWDRYRGGLEYLAARAGSQLADADLPQLCQRIQFMIAVRMSVAIRLRHARRANPIDTFMIAMRLRGTGHERLCPVPLGTLGAEAMLHFLFNDTELNRHVGRLLCLGDFKPEVQDCFRRLAHRPVEFATEWPSGVVPDNTLVFVRGEHAIVPAEDVHKNVRVVYETELMEKFQP